MIQVSNVLADEGLAVDYESNRVLEVGAESEYGAVDWKRSSGAGRISARTAKNRWAEDAHPNDRVIHAASDGAVADNKAVGDPGELVERVLVSVGDGFARPIRAGHDQDFGGSGGEQQIMQRSVGQHHAELIIV